MGKPSVKVAVRRLLAEVHFAKAQLARDSVNGLEQERQLKEAISSYEPFYKAHLEYGELLLRNTPTEKQDLAIAWSNASGTIEQPPAQV